jgi:hypothetical protein
MKLLGVSFLKKLLKETSGQTMYIMVLAMSSMIGLSGLAVDLGHGYYAIQQLQASTNMAALAGAAVMPDTDTASSNVTAYSSGSGDRNATGLLTNVHVTTSFLCLNTFANATTDGVPCVASTGSTSGNFNAMRVIQTASTPTWFGCMFGLCNFNIAAVSTSLMAGGTNTPYNIAVIVDTTASMAAADNGTQCSGTQISCALGGVQSLLQLLFPCASGTTCTAISGTQQVKNPVDSVALFVFPAVTTATMSKDYVCNTSDPTTIPYTFTNVTTGSSQNLNPPATATYEVIPFSGNYKASDSATSLTASSDIVIAAGASGISGCSGIQAPGGQGTYYAQVIYEAQAALVAQQTANPGTQNMMIIVSDGDATASASSGQIKATTGTLNGTGTASSNPTGYHSYTYPSALGECGQAIVAAQAAASAGTKVITIGYGAETSGCTTDATYSAYKGITPCKAIQDMASDSNYFFSDDGDGCVSPNQTHLTNLVQIFEYVVGITQTPRIVPNATT